ncbi:phage/plasmid primase, P4 family, C-terminal domain-containing protein [Halopelagius inordinatus]|uniref:Phage/plasmid primase, P4 family, C-terminal domain-containing protein n=1 Tax=Halopelagius inordinatus TaxID=553467 RepID=A0A1I2WU90_9EURY|nr:phage/plasmid primase, P4 family [Halopelagius inordinatus]SFH04910.1 phage/plasmid primase, P4 family, C-terminal domain-containing protein [Halopelagius inordinatus]
MSEITDPADCRRIVEERISESPLPDRKYFHRVADGSKRSYGHQKASDRSATPPQGNYGIHAAAGGTLVLVDIDDHKDGYDEEALTFARENLPETLTFSSAHGGEGRLYHVPEDGDGLLPAARLEKEFGKANISSATWGEIRVSNQYIVAAGSQLDADGCTKDECDECSKPDGGRYTILHDRPIATLNADLLVKVLAADPDVTKVSETADDAPEGDEEPSTARRSKYEPDGDTDAYDALEALDCERVAEKTIVADWNDDHGSGDAVRAFYPIWNPACNGTANVAGREGWRDTAGKGRGGPVVMAAIACDDLPEYDENTTPSDVSGKDWVTAYDYLRELGFDLPPLSAERSGPESAPSWEYVRYLFEEEGASPGRAAAQSLLREKYHFMTTDVKDELYVYDEEAGIFTPELGDIRAEIYEGLTAEHWSTHNVREILAGLKQLNRVSPRQFNGREAFDAPHVCVENGVLDLFSRELKDHSPEYKFVNRVPVTYDPDVDTTRFEEFMETITSRDEDAKAMLEMVGHALVPDAHERGWKLFLLLHGGSDNGKSFFYDRVSDLLDGFDGEESNTMNVKLAKLASNRFSKDSMYGHFANIAGEINGKKIRNTADLKDITGGDSMEIEPKGGESFSDTMNTTLMFAANDPPIIGNRDKRAIATRIVPVKLPYTFTENPTGPMEKEKVPERVLEEELATPEAMSALLSLALDGIERLRENHGDVSLPESPMERLERYEGDADPMMEFGKKCLTSDSSDYIVKADVTRIYEEWAEAEGHEVGSNANKALFAALDYPDSKPRSPDYSSTSLPLRPWDQRKEVLDRVTLTEEGLEYARAAGLFVEETDEEPTGDGLAALETGQHDSITVEFGGQMKPRPWLAEEGWFVDAGDLAMDYRVREGNGQPNPMRGVSEGDLVRITNARVKTEDGIRHVEIMPGCTVEVVEAADDDTDSQDDNTPQAAADGGEPDPEATDGDEDEEPPTQNGALWGAYKAQDAGDGVSKADLMTALQARDYDISTAQMVVENAAKRGYLIETSETDVYQATDKLARPE